MLEWYSVKKNIFDISYTNLRFIIHKRNYFFVITIAFYFKFKNFIIDSLPFILPPFYTTNNSTNYLWLCSFFINTSALNSDNILTVSYTKIGFGHVRNTNVLCLLASITIEIFSVESSWMNDLKVVSVHQE